uniref:(northern house mosquito) hypothetical protein n=1 Tax=Culex pipiens TaxID=7175 RepID=A0A8D8FFA1_CULPI
MTVEAFFQYPFVNTQNLLFIIVFCTFILLKNPERNVFGRKKTKTGMFLQSNSRRSNPQRKQHFNKTFKNLEELRWQLNSYRKQHTNITHKHSNHANVYPNNRSFIYL